MYADCGGIDPIIEIGPDLAKAVDLGPFTCPVIGTIVNECQYWVLVLSHERETLTSPLDKRQKPRPARRREIHPEIRLVKSWVAIFIKKKRLRQDFPAAQGLSNPGWPFSPKKKRLRQDLPAATGLVRSRPKSGPAPKHQIWHKLGPESTVWVENLSKWIVRAVRTHLDHSQDSGRRPRPNFASPARRSRAINVSPSFTCESFIPTCK